MVALLELQGLYKSFGAVQVLHDVDLAVHAGEIVGVAGVSGNGQRELMQSLVGQRRREAGRVRVAGRDFRASRRENRELKVRSLPEEPLANACVADLGVAQNMALRQFDEPPFARAGWVQWGRLRARARRWIVDYGVKTTSEPAPIRTLSGGTVPRAVLARELDGEAALLLGRPYRMTGKVIEGAKLGRKLGFPTANLRPQRRATPLAGVFAIRVSGGGLQNAPGVASLGTRPAVNGKELLLEAHVFDFDGDLYRQLLHVDFSARLRDEMWFPDMDGLVEQMKQDAARAREILSR